MKRRLVVIFFLCLYSLVGMAQEVKIYPERTVYYKSGINNELVWVSEENYIKELTWFQYNETYISLNFYIGEYRYTYFLIMNTLKQRILMRKYSTGAVLLTMH